MLTVTVAEVQEVRAGWFFDATTVPTVTTVETRIIPDALAMVRNAFRQVSVSLEDLTPGSDSYRHIHRYAVYQAAALVFEAQFGAGAENPYQRQATVLRDQVLRQPEAFGGEIERDQDPWAGGPASAATPDLQEDLQDRFGTSVARYLSNRTGGF